MTTQMFFVKGYNSNNQQVFRQILPSYEEAINLGLAIRGKYSCVYVTDGRSTLMDAENHGSIYNIYK